VSSTSPALGDRRWLPAARLQQLSVSCQTAVCRSESLYWPISDGGFSSKKSAEGPFRLCSGLSPSVDGIGHSAVGETPSQSWTIPSLSPSGPSVHTHPKPKPTLLRFIHQLDYRKAAEVKVARRPSTPVHPSNLGRIASHRSLSQLSSLPCRHASYPLPVGAAPSTEAQSGPRSVQYSSVERKLQGSCACPAATSLSRACIVGTSERCVVGYGAHQTTHQHRARACARYLHSIAHSALNILLVKEARIPRVVLPRRPRFSASPLPLQPHQPTDLQVPACFTSARPADVADATDATDA